MDLDKKIETKTARRLRAIGGTILIVLGVVSILTPLTPFGWLIIIGLELLGLETIFKDKIKAWFNKKKAL
ncbi:hypothetical protein C4553_03795 [Candidatus Parcubacteria bacterium]|nr:MAG: hypothetical protein C4553_03795 [Candidatus Parcubacteria bacterium]